MNFPRFSHEVEDFLKSLQHLPLEKQIEIINQPLTQFYFPLANETVALMREYRDQLVYLKEKQDMQIHEEAINFRISSGIKSYKDLFIFILSHPRNGSIVGAEILSRMNYLDKMTRDVTFTVPGYDRAKEGDDVVNESCNSLQLTFDENVFIEIVQRLEDQSGGKFQYNDECELVFIGQKEDGRYDFDNLLRLNLERLFKKRGVDPVKLIVTVSQRFRTANKNDIDINRYVSQILSELTMSEEQPTKKVFIAGAKRLKQERALLREELNKVENSQNIDIRSLTFEDFATSLTGEDGGRQANYNKFIQEEADAVVFIFDTTAGEITEEEFDVAYSSLVENKHPDIFVYVRKRHSLLDCLFMDRRLHDIKNRIFGYNKEYYIEYDSLDNLRYLFYSDMMDYFKKRT